MTPPNHTAHKPRGSARFHFCCADVVSVLKHAACAACGVAAGGLAEFATATWSAWLPLAAAAAASTLLKAGQRWLGDTR